MSEHRCAKRIWSHGGFNGRACQRPGVIEEDGKHWCHQHAPSAVSERRAKSMEKVNAAIRKESNEIARRIACLAACAGVDDPQPGELAALRAEVARMKERV